VGKKLKHVRNIFPGDGLLEKVTVAIGKLDGSESEYVLNPVIKGLI